MFFTVFDCGYMQWSSIEPDLHLLLVLMSLWPHSTLWIWPAEMWSLAILLWTEVRRIPVLKEKKKEKSDYTKISDLEPYKWAENILSPVSAFCCRSFVSIVWESNSEGDCFFISDALLGNYFIRSFVLLMLRELLCVVLYKRIAITWQKRVLWIFYI